VITETKNSSATLERTIESVLKQTYPNIEYIIVDGKSTDRTLEIASRYEDRLALVISGEDSSAGDAANKGIAAASGEYVCIIPSDDVMERDYVERCVAALERSAADYVFGDLIYCAEGEAPLLIPGDPGYACRIRHSMPNLNSVTIMYRRASFEVGGLFDPNNRYCSDYDWLLRAHLAGLKGAYDSSIKCRYSHGGISSGNYMKAVAAARDVAIRHGGSVLAANIVYWHTWLKWAVRKNLKAVLPDALYYAALRLFTRTGVRPYERIATTAD
jgi:glycosyltransferase involved in cell wall biosynthesis